ncbi:hypothetical protein ALP59_200040 [Pseudomonas savastanoi]|uniref:Uncharacterized protein n=3 Tax=Pseudomonas syringae group TaxID=136849 RepID=A0A3M5GFJ3_PSESS|nr:hypothetical protein ALP59_200040 [Pseudomonas savastanoi]
MRPLDAFKVRPTTFDHSLGILLRRERLMGLLLTPSLSILLEASLVRSASNNELHHTIGKIESSPCTVELGNDVRPLLIGIPEAHNLNIRLMFLGLCKPFYRAG